MKKYGNVEIPPQKTSWNTTSCTTTSSYHLFFNFGCSKQAFPLRTATPPAKKKVRCQAPWATDHASIKKFTHHDTHPWCWWGMIKVWHRLGGRFGRWVGPVFFCPQASSSCLDFRWLMVSKWCFELGSILQKSVSPSTKRHRSDTTEDFSASACSTWSKSLVRLDSLRFF